MSVNDSLPAVTDRRKQIVILRKAIADLKSIGFHDSGTVVQELAKELIRINRPQLNEVLYLDKNGERPVKVVVAAPGSWSVGYVPLDADIQYTHQGNLYDELGNSIYSQGV